MALLNLLDRIAKIRGLLAGGNLGPMAHDLRMLNADLLQSLADGQFSPDEWAKLAIDAVQLAVDLAVSKLPE